MSRKLVMSAVSVMVLALVFCGNSLSQDQGKKVPAPQAAPPLPGSYSREVPKTGLAAKATRWALIARGGFAISFSTADRTNAVFELGGRGFEVKLAYLGTSSDSAWLYYQVEGWQLIFAIANHASSGKHAMWYFANGGTTPAKYADALAYPPAN